MEGGGLQFEFRATGAELDPDSDTALLAAGHPTRDGAGRAAAWWTRGRRCTVAPSPPAITARLTGGTR